MSAGRQSGLRLLLRDDDPTTAFRLASDAGNKRDVARTTGKETRGAQIAPPDLTTHRVLKRSFDVGRSLSAHLRTNVNVRDTLDTLRSI